MIKRAGVLLAAVYLFAAVLIPSPVQAQGGIAVVNSSAEPEFPLKLHFNLSARSDVNITDIRLRYTVDRDSFVQVTSEVSVRFSPSTAVDVGWTLEMVKIGGLPPGSSLEYWWVLRDAASNRLETAPVRVRFEDNRYSWRSLTEGKVTIYWYEGNQAFAQELMDSAQQALSRLAGDTGAYLEKPVSIYVYGNTRDLQGAMIYPQEWTGGVAFSRHGIISIGIAPRDLDWGKRAVVHELTHLAVHQMTFNPYSGLPSWLSEGLAMYAEGALEPEYVGFLNEAIAKNGLISVRSLSSPFSAYAEQSLLAYAESYSLVEYLVADYGQGKMLELLNIFEQGSGYDDALRKAYGFDMDGLDSRWRGYVGATGGARANAGKAGLYVVTVGLFIGLGLAAKYSGLRFRL